MSAFEYAPTTWQDSPSTATPLTAARLNKLEQGTRDASVGPKIAFVTDTKYAGGAKGDGVTNDYAAINAAIQAVATSTMGSGVVFFPSGVYRSTSTFLVPRNIYLVGENSSSSRLVYDGATTTDAFLTFGKANEISVNSGVRYMAISANLKAATIVRLYGPQEGAHLIGNLLTGGTRYGVDVISTGMAGGSNKFVIEKCWIWTEGDAGEAGAHFGPGAGPATIRETTFVGVNRPSYPVSGPAGSAGIKTEGGFFLIENVNVEHFESHTNATSTNLFMNTPTSFFCTYGVTLATTNTPLIVHNASFDSVTACLRNTSKNLTIPFFVNYRGEAYDSDRRSLDHNQWSFGSSNINSGTGDLETQLGYAVYGNGDATRFKVNSIRPDGRGWIEVANVDSTGTFGTGASAWNGAHFRMGAYRLWIDASGRLRVKNGAPTSDTDGALVGTQT